MTEYISREQWEQIEREVEALREDLSENKIARTQRMAYSQAYNDFDSEAGARRIRAHARENNLSFEDAVIELAERELPPGSMPHRVLPIDPLDVDEKHLSEVNPAFKTAADEATVDLGEEALDREINRIAREERISYAEAAERIMGRDS